MSANNPAPVTPAPSSLELPSRPDFNHLRSQAQDLKKSGAALSLSKAQFVIARAYGFSSWPALKKHVEAFTLAGQLKAAIDAGDYELCRKLMINHPELHRAALGYGNNGPLTWVAECRVPRTAPTSERLAFARWMIQNGSDVHQGGDGPLMRAALDDTRIAMMDLLLEHGADVNALWNGNYPIILAPCETLAPQSLKWLLDHGADPNRYPDQNPLAMVLFTYSRNAKGKQACLEVLHSAGYQLPRTAPMALARGRADVLAELLTADPQLLTRTFRQEDIFPATLGQPSDGLTFVPLDGTSLLHQAVEFEDDDMVRWILEHGADPNLPADIDSDGFGGHTPLFHSVISIGDRSASRTKLLLNAGANPNFKCTFRKQLRDMGDAEKEKMFEFNDVSPIGFARKYQEPQWINTAAIEALAAHGGQE